MEIVTKIAPIVLALIMLGLGLGLSIKDFTRILVTPKDFLIGIFSQLIILPIIAFLIAIILDLSLPISVGLMIIAAAPGGVTSNVLTKFANGDVALSISLTAITSLISIISVPFIVVISAELITIIGIVIIQIKLVTAVKEMDKATSPLANLVNTFEVTPPGAAAMIMRPTAIADGRSRLSAMIKATIGNKII